MLFIIYGYVDLRDLHSFPTRRSSDLSRETATEWRSWKRPCRARPTPCCRAASCCATTGGERASRSEEHTSELHLVCRLLLEKKKSRLTTIATCKLALPSLPCRASSA